MMSPEAFGRTHKRHVTDIVRVALERKGVIGFIDVHDGMTLLEARTLIWENVEDAPAEFQFVLDDGAPVSARQEGTQKIAYFYPMVRIRELRRGPAPSPLASPRRTTAGVGATKTNMNPSPSSSEKVCVSTASGEEFHVWITDDYTFQQLRRDAARYWNIPGGEVALADGEGCLWPEQAKILSLMSVEDLHNKGIILEYKGGTIAAKAPNSVSLKDAMSAATVGRDKRPSARRAVSASALSVSLPPPIGLSRTAQPSISTFALRRTLSATDPDLVSSEPPLSAPSSNPVEELWRIFTFYCVNGDSMELECLKAHQFNKLLRDSRVFGGHLTPAMVDIIYTSETKGRLQTSGKMNYEEFLNALVKVARAAHTKGNRANCSSSKLLCDSEEEDELFQRLVMDHILPLASRWPTSTWLQHTQRLRRPEIVSFISKFLEPLVEMFMFYAKSYVLNASGVKEFYMSYGDYTKFINDFCFANLPLSSVEAAHVFLASCSSPLFHGALFEAAAGGNDKTQTMDCNDSSSQTAESVSGSTGAGNSTSSGIASIQRILESVEGVVAYAFPQNQVGRMCMGVSAFLDALGRIGLTAFTKTRTLKTIHCVKGVFHHLSRGLTRSRVLEILKNHGSTSLHATKFYSGSVAFNNKFVDMWRYEGSPDYLTLDTINGYPGSPDAKLMSSVPAPVGISTGTEAIVCSTGAPFVGNTSRRIFSAPFSSSTLFNDRGVPNGSGRGREALDRLVRNAFLRNAIAANEQKISAIDTRQATLPSADRSGSPPRSPSLHLRTSSAASLPPSPLNKVPLRHEEEKAFFESILLKGGVFKKYGQWGNPHRRFVWCSKDFDAIYWRPLNKKSNLTKDGITVTSMVSVLPGNSARTRYAFMKHLSDDKALSRCFSVVAEDRRLDLEADSEATRELWTSALMFLMRENRARLIRKS
ncbi:hypothetical protein PHYSODRAFT_486062 [Phytophthora sojae]|uniref:PH domain-containing protein n=1 Tax=Phytophthora sojae (strain P6497) TaxID=1094619 RepID=G4Z177_PHYSP|nr:hypothetical protein PHYSODRAFT_486062 [Phytophthora sojae]EGZ24696.1 hypothetical protein PHYSODRAFT_486062 [Phytophthora sojae]|eukprot:XP_009519984.1 hypothetical protein PHYSODRAFT_486062 [Phytophthora sojae]